MLKMGSFCMRCTFWTGFKFIHKLKTEGLPARPEKGWKVVKPVRKCIPQDTSSIPKAIGMGVHAKHVIFYEMSAYKL